MSVQVMTWVMQQAPTDLKPSEMLVALMLAEHANPEGGHAFPSLARLSELTRLGRSTVIDALASLVKRGVIAVEAEATNKLPTVYCFPEFGVQNLDVQILEVQISESRGPDSGPKPLEEPSYTPPSIPPQAKPKRKPRVATSLPEEFSPGESGQAFAVARGWTDERIAFEVERFRAHHQGKGTLSKDWAASWRTWVLNGVAFDRERRERRPVTQAQINRGGTGRVVT